MEKLNIDLGSRSYDILIGSGVLDLLVSELKEKETGKKGVFVSNDSLYKLYGQELLASLREAGLELLEIIIPDGERYKDWSSAGEILSEMLKAQIGRDGYLLAFGGGVIGDLAGFAASIYQRGIKFYQIPTSLLAQVDSSVGGKVAVNHNQGKNMIGSFYQPERVYIDTDVLASLPDREWKSGLGEIIKYGIINDADFFTFLENNIEKIKGKDQKIFKEIIGKSCQIKAKIVQEDERETGLRAILNLGHTIAHGIETITEYEYFRHGEAVSAGIGIISSFACEKGLLPAEDYQRINKIFHDLDMVYKLPKMPAELFMQILALDKKNQSGKMVLILPEKIGQVKISKDFTTEELKEFLLAEGICKEEVEEE